MRRVALLGSLLVALVAGVSSCSDKTDGQAVPGGGVGTSTESHPTTGPSTPSRTTTSRPDGGSGSLPKDPCSLLTADGRSQLGLGNGQRRTQDGEPSCRWQLRGPSETFFFDVTTLADFGITDVPASVQQLPDIGKHKAAQGSGFGGPGTCTIILGVTQSSRVDSTVTAGTDTQKACGLAKDLATHVERELP